uniref:Uncharacterized protein n=1 Tax=Cucumis melo TaxID=3656 RepID=A0A9I9E2V4_CUCME
MTPLAYYNVEDKDIYQLLQISNLSYKRYGNGTVVVNMERGWWDLIFHKIRVVDDGLISFSPSTITSSYSL